MLQIVSQKTFFGTVESCVIDDDRVVVLCFLCEKIRDNKEAKEVQMAFNTVPMAIIISPKQANSVADFATLRAKDKISLLAKKWEDGDITYEVRNLTLQQKYQDPAVYLGCKANQKLSEDPRSVNDRLIPATYLDQDRVTAARGHQGPNAPYGREHME